MAEVKEVTMTVVNHDGVEYPVDTPVTKIAGLSEDQAEELRKAGAIGKPAVPESVSTELAEKEAEVEALKAKIAALEAAAATPEKK